MLAEFGLGHLYLAQGDLEAALRVLDQGLTLCRATDNREVGIVTAAALGYASCLLAGCVDEACQHAGQALALAKQYGERGHEAFALYQLGAVHAQADPPEVAQSEVRYREALALAEELGMRPLQAHCHRGLGMLYAMTCQREQARTALSTAIAMYQSMDMTFWLPQTEAALAQVEGQ
jgi:tetratricopeptide (TPR) repeat protein